MSLPQSVYFLGKKAVSAIRYGALVPSFLGTVLLLASALKGYDLATAPTAEANLWTSRWFQIAVVEAEFAVGLWLLSGLWRPAARRAALVAFVAFFVVSLSKALAGETSCGCFGPVPVSPRYTAGLDLTAILSLQLWHPSHREGKWVGSRLIRSASVLLLFLLVGVSSGIVLASSRPGVLGSEGEIDAQQAVVLLEPEKWVGRRCPLLEYIDIGDELSRGDWLVVLYHHDCSRCQEVVPQYEVKARVAESEPAAPRVALIAVPPHGPPLGPSAPGPSCRQGRLDESKNWFVTTPAVLRLQDGVVQAEAGG